MARHFSLSSIVERYRRIVNYRHRQPPHVHDYEMKFIGDTLDFDLICKCGDIAPNMDIALQRMRASQGGFAARMARRFFRWPT